MPTSDHPSEPPPWPHGDKYPDTPWIGGGPPRPARSVWSDIGVAIAVVAGIVGVVAVGFIILVVVSLNSLGNNK
jgi:hypothetical protein